MDMCIDMYMDMCINMCIDMCIAMPPAALADDHGGDQHSTHAKLCCRPSMPVYGRV